MGSSARNECLGGIIAAQGTPEDSARSEASHTGRFLREVLARRPLRAPKRQAAESPLLRPSEGNGGTT